MANSRSYAPPGARNRARITVSAAGDKIHRLRRRRPKHGHTQQARDSRRRRPRPGHQQRDRRGDHPRALEGVEVVGIRDGFEWIMQGDIDHVTAARPSKPSAASTSAAARTSASRAPTRPRSPALLENTVHSLLRLNVSQLITIGGDDTAFSAMKLAEHAAGRLRVVHVPKTIDNDLDLPPHIDTFGFQTARHFGVEIVKNLMVDAKTTSRWYFVIAMGRKAGHLALGIGKAAGATLTLIPEEFAAAAPAEDDRRHAGRRDHQAPELRPPRRRRGHRRRASSSTSIRSDLAELEGSRARRARPLRIAEVNIGEILKAQVAAAPEGARHQDDDRRQEHRLRAALRRPDSVRHGVHARPRLLRGEVPRLSGGNAAMVSMQGGHFVPIPFKRHARPEDRPHARPPGRHRLDALRDRAPLHDPPAQGRLRGSARAGEVRRDRGPLARRVQKEFGYLVVHDPPAAHWEDGTEFK